jgi:anti-sigma factor RsiW
MCDFSGKLIAWTDRELPADDAAEVERHVDACSECRDNVDAFKRASSEFEAYCDAEIASNMPREISRWAPAVAAATAVAAFVALFIVWPRPRIVKPAFGPAQVTSSVSPAAVAKSVAATVIPVRRIPRHQVIAPVRIPETSSASTLAQNAGSAADEAMIQIAIPADEMFPPGAVPDGVHFAADLTIAADGSAEGLRLRPRLDGFERRPSQP